MPKHTIIGPDVAQSYFSVHSTRELARKCPILALTRGGHPLTSATVQKTCSHYLAPCLPSVRQHGAHIVYLQQKKQTKKLNEPEQKEGEISDLGRVIQQGM